MLAAAIGIDRLLEEDVGRIVLGDDRARLLDDHLGRQGGQFLLDLPAVVEALALRRLVAAGGIRGGAPAPAAIHLDPVGRIVHAPARGLCRLQRRALYRPQVEGIAGGIFGAGGHGGLERIRHRELSNSKNKSGTKSRCRRQECPSDVG